MHKDSSEDLIILVTIAITVLLSAILLIFSLYRRRHRSHLREKDELRLSYEQEMLKTQLEIQEWTFKKISQEIHDNIGQLLGLVRLNLSTMDISLPSNLEQKIYNSKKLVSQAIYDLRNLSHGLNTDYIADLGLSKAIEYELEMIRKSGNYETLFLPEGNFYALTKQHELILFRIVQETLNNIIKHSASKKITIHLLYRAEELILSILDDGKGFDLTPLNFNSSFGLGIKNMHNRARLIGAGFLISSTLEKGTSVTVAVPIGPATT
jgi:two-component system NarL family sensor kinase